jgi:hypothetical protein
LCTYAIAHAVTYRNMIKRKPVQPFLFKKCS